MADSVLDRKWSKVVALVTERQASRGALLTSSTLWDDDGETLIVRLPKGSKFAIKMLGRADSYEVIMPTVREVFGMRGVVYEEEPERVVMPTLPDTVEISRDEYESLLKTDRCLNRVVAALQDEGWEV